MRLLKANNITNIDLIQSATSTINTHGSEAILLSNSEDYQVSHCAGILSRLHGGGRADVFLFEKNNQQICVKYFHDNRKLTKVKNALHIGRAFTAYNRGLLLEKKGIPAPKVIAISQTKTRQPILFMEMINDHTQINFLLEQWVAKGIDLLNYPPYSQLAHDFTNFVISLHNHNIYHKDFSPRNVLTQELDGHFSFYLIDLEDVSSSISIPDTTKHFLDRLKRYVGSDAHDLFADILHKKHVTN